MDGDFILKCVTAVLGIFGVGRVIYDLVVGKIGRLREEYKFANEFLTDVAIQPDMPQFAKDKGFQAIAGSTNMTTAEIEYLLSLQNPVQAIKDYTLGRNYLTHLPDSGKLQITFRKKYTSSWSRLWRKLMYGFLYFLSLTVAVSPLLFSSRFSFNDSKSILGAIGVFIVGSIYVWITLSAGIRIQRGEHLVENQHRHTQRIILPPVI